jgi:tRNA(Ile)-lysidine synthase
MPQHFTIARALGPIAAQLAAWPGAGPRPTSLHVACSGGPDSVALVGLLACLARRFSLKISIGNVDHGLRAESELESRFVERLAQRFGFQFATTKLALEPGPGLPARARCARYGALREQAAQLGAPWLVLGHSATDQAETLMMHLVRGAGLIGLGAMPPCSDDGIWRPLLHLDRDEIRNIARHLDLEFCEDPTNLDLRHWRVRLREVIFPQLALENPRVVHAMAAASAHAQKAEEALSTWVDREISQRTTGTGWSSIDGFDKLPEAIATRVVRRWLADGGADLTRLKGSIVADIAKAAGAWGGHLGGSRSEERSPRPLRWNLHPNCEISLDRRGIRVQPSPPDCSQST